MGSHVWGDEAGPRPHTCIESSQKGSEAHTSEPESRNTLGRKHSSVNHHDCGSENDLSEVHQSARGNRRKQGTRWGEEGGGGAAPKGKSFVPQRTPSGRVKTGPTETVKTFTNQPTASRSLRCGSLGDSDTETLPTCLLVACARSLGKYPFALLKARLFGFYCCKSSLISYIQVLITDQSPEDFMA